MASGKSLEMRYFRRTKAVEPLTHPTPGRDRSLSGKKRRLARKAANRAKA